MSRDQKIATVWLVWSALQNVAGVVGMCLGWWLFSIIIMASGCIAFFMANSVYSLGDMAGDFMNDMSSRERETRNRQERLDEIQQLIRSISSDPTPSQAPTESPAPTPVPRPTPTTSPEEREAEQHINSIFRL